MTKLITIAVLGLTLVCAFFMFYKLKSVKKESIPLDIRLKLIFTGVMAFISDTIGVGSFAVNTALSKAFNLFEDDELPGMMNGAQIIPGAISSIFFMHLIQVDYTTLTTLVLGTCLGGVLGGYFVTRLSQQMVRLCMIIAFSGVATLLFFKNIGVFPEAGEITALSFPQLVIGFFAMAFCGSLTSVGIGLFAMVQAILFMMHASPAIAFPIMTTAGAMQQPLTTLVFLKRDRIPLQKTMIISLSGIAGVLIALPIISHMNTNWLHQLLFVIMVYNITSITLSYRRKKHAIRQELEPGPA